MNGARLAVQAQLLRTWHHFLEVEKQVAHYQKHWRPWYLPDPARCPTCGRRVNLVANDQLTEGGKDRVIHYGRCLREGAVWAWEADGGWRRAEGDELRRAENLLAHASNPCWGRE